MKKTLFLSAILGAVVYSNAFALTGWGSGTNIYCIDSNPVPLIDGTTRTGGINIVNDTKTNYTTEVNAVNLSATQALSVIQSPWDGHPAFAKLTIDSINVENNGTSGLLTAEAGHTVEVKAVSGTLGGAVVGTGSKLTLGTAGQTIKMAGTIANNGALSLYGTLNYDLSDLSVYQVYSRSITRENMQENGFADSYKTTYYALKSAPAVSGAVTFSGFDGSDITYKDWAGNNFIFTKAADASYASSVYMVNSGTVENADITDASRFFVGAGAVLSVTANGTAAIEGSGTVAVSKIASNSWTHGNSLRGLTLDADNWTGWVSLTGTGSSGTGFNYLGANVAIGSKGYEGWDSQNWQGTNSQNIRLDGDWKNRAYTTQQNSNPTSTFSGTWTGEGDFLAYTDASNQKINYTYSGNISGWNGKFKSGAGTTLLTLSGNATTMNADVESGSGTLNMRISTGSLATLNGDITVKDLTLVQSSAFNGVLTVKGNIAQSGQHSLRIFNAADITGSVNMTNMSTFTNETVTLHGGATIGTTMYVGGAKADVRFTGSEKTYTFATLSTSHLTATGTETGTAASDRKITVGAGASVNTTKLDVGWGLTQLTLEDGATLTTGSIQYGQGAAYNHIGSLTLNAGSTLTIGSEAEGEHNFTLTTSGLTVNGSAAINADLVVSGGTITFADNAVLTMGCDVTIGDAVTVVLTDTMIDAVSTTGSYELFESVGTATLGNVTFVDKSGVALSGYELVQIGDKIVVAPEPATATLSLLALAALCARRKRH